jgi:hypothetical protein
LFFEKVINDSLMSGKFPECWKSAVVEPIEKVKNAVLPEEFRPINKLPVAEKILEFVVKEQLEEFLHKCNIFVEQQSGFRKFHSCESAINYVLHDWRKQLENKKIIITVSLDFKRAFETISRQKLMAILEKYGIRGKELEWFNDYFTNRKQKVKIDEFFSKEKLVDHGVSQGTCLGPLTYLLAVNFLPLVLKHSSVSMFADDTLITVTSDSLEDALTKLNDDLQILFEWICFNSLALNVSKTKCMVLGSKNLNLDNIEVKIGGQTIERVAEIKYLGVIIDDRLNFLSHLKYIKKKLHAKLAMFRKIGPKIDKFTKIILYKSLIAPHFDYCSSILFSLSDTRIKELQKIQNKFMRNILCVSRYTSIGRMLNAIGFQSIYQRLAFNNLKLIYKIEHDLAPRYLKILLKKNKEKYNYNLRRKSLYQIPNFIKESSQKSLFYKTLMLYNECKQNFEETDFRNLAEFCRRLKNFVKTKYAVEHQIDHL